MTQTPAKRDFAIDWIKGLLMLFIVLLHTCQIPVLRHGYIAVDLFFFISGFYLMQSFVRKPMTAVSYTWSRVKRFYLPYLLCFIFSCLIRYKGLSSFTDFDSFMDRFAKFPFYLTMTEEIGPKVLTEHIIQGSWFLSVLLLSGFLIYSMLEYDRRLATHILFPFICILGYTLIFTTTPVIMDWSRIGAFSIPLLRGLCAMAAGAWMNSIWQDYRPAIERRSVLINVAGILSFVLFIALMFTKESFDLYILPVMPWIVLAAVIGKSWFNSALGRINGGLMSIVGRNTIYVLFAHPPVVTVVNWTNEQVLGSALKPAAVVGISLLLTLVATLVLKYVCEFIQTRWKRDIATP